MLRYLLLTLAYFHICVWHSHAVSQLSLNGDDWTLMQRTTNITGEYIAMHYESV